MWIMKTMNDGNDKYRESHRIKDAAGSDDKDALHGGFASNLCRSALHF